MFALELYVEIAITSVWLTTKTLTILSISLGKVNAFEFSVAMIEHKYNLCIKYMAMPW